MFRADPELVRVSIRRCTYDVWCATATHRMTGWSAVALDTTAKLAVNQALKELEGYARAHGLPVVKEHHRSR
jgi:hypothetical protein